MCNENPSTYNTVILYWFNNLFKNDSYLNMLKNIKYYFIDCIRFFKKTSIFFNLFLNLKSRISNLQKKHAILCILNHFLHFNEIYPYLLLSILWPDIVLLTHFFHPSDNGRSLVIYIEVPVRPFPKHLQKWGTGGILWHHKSMMSQLEKWTNTNLWPYSLGHAMNRKDSWKKNIVIDISRF